MTFTIRIRGAGGTIDHEYLCDTHGRFVASVSRADCPDSVQCPTCGLGSPWSPSSSPAVHTQFVVTASRGKNDPKPTPQSMDTRPLAEGQSYTEWRKERKKMWEVERHKRVKELLE